MNKTNISYLTPFPSYDAV